MFIEYWGKFFKKCVSLNVEQKDRYRYKVHMTWILSSKSLEIGEGNSCENKWITM